MNIMLAVLTAATYLNATVADVSFRTAKPIWPQGRETEMNLLVGFRATFEGNASVAAAPRGGRSEKVILRVTGANLYRAFLNGRFVGHGPARGPHGYHRVDEWDLTPLLGQGPQVLAIEVAGYNVNNAYIAQGTMTYEVLEGWWTDAGTFESLHRASNLVADGGANHLDGEAADALTLSGNAK